jgi:hypothetical protein
MRRLKNQRALSGANKDFKSGVPCQQLRGFFSG